MYYRNSSNSSSSTILAEYIAVSSKASELVLSGFHSETTAAF